MVVRLVVKKSQRVGVNNPNQNKIKNRVGFHPIFLLCFKTCFYCLLSSTFANEYNTDDIKD